MSNLQKGVTTPIVIGIVVFIIAAGGAFYYFTQSDEMMNNSMQKADSTMTKDEGESMMDKDDAENGSMVEEKDGAMIQNGSYGEYSPEKLSLASSGKVLLFFHAPWCPICRGIESEIQANPNAIPDRVHILKIDFDSAATLRQKYGVTTQHTFVQVDASGKAIQKWNNAVTLADTLARIR